MRKAKVGIIKQKIATRYTKIRNQNVEISPDYLTWPDAYDNFNTKTKTGSLVLPNKRDLGLFDWANTVQ